MGLTIVAVALALAAGGDDLGLVAAGLIAVLGVTAALVAIGLVASCRALVRVTVGVLVVVVSLYRIQSQYSKRDKQAAKDLPNVRGQKPDAQRTSCSADLCFATDCFGL